MHPRRTTLFIATALAAIALLAVSCTDGNSGLDDKTQQLNELAEKREAREKELESMTVAQLVNELQKDADRGTEPFNSMPYSELVSRGDRAASELHSLLRQADRSDFLSLLALRQMDSTLYLKLDPLFRVGVLVNALKMSEFFNAWGLPHLYWEDAAQAIIDEGRAAEDELKQLLDDQRPAPMWGSDEVIEYRMYSYRVRDYAWALLKEIRGEELDIPTDPKIRDELISDLLSQQ
jgi:hypothetical protein